MKNVMIRIFSLFIILSLLFPSCQALKNTNKTQRGAVIGAAGGAVLGGVIGNNVGNKKNSALGAILGAVVGGVAGGVIGNKMDKQAKKIESTLPGAEVVRNEEGIQIILDENSDVRFNSNKSDLKSASKSNLDKLINIFTEYPETNILIVGHTDSTGSDEYNQSLSERRAYSVLQYLQQQGITRSRLKSVGVGEKEPRIKNDTDAGRAANRRVEFAITANEKMIQEAQEMNK